MSTEQQWKMLECAAKACWIEQTGFINTLGVQYVAGSEDSPYTEYWNPLTNPADTAEMCAKLEIGTEWVGIAVRCFCENVEIDAHFKDHDNSRLKAWMFAATMCAAKIGGYTE